MHRFRMIACVLSVGLMVGALSVSHAVASDGTSDSEVAPNLSVVEGAAAEGPCQDIISDCPVPEVRVAPNTCDAPAQEACVVVGYPELVSDLECNAAVDYCPGVPLVPAMAIAEEPPAPVTEQAATPSGCKGSLGLPHKSKHVAGTINSSGKTHCTLGPVPRIYVSAQLWEQRWWGWDRVGNFDSQVRTPGQKVRAFSSWECRKNWFRVTTRHEVTDVDRRDYYINQVSREVWNPCG